MATQTDKTVAAWVTAAKALSEAEMRQCMAAVDSVSGGNDDDAADALPFVMTAVAAGQNVKAAAVVAVSSARKDRFRREAAAHRTVLSVAAVEAIRTEGTDAHPVTPTPPTWEDVRPTLPVADRTVLDALAADAKASRTGALHPDAPRPLRATVVAAAVGAKAPKTAAQSMALRAVPVAAWARVSEAITPGPETVEERGERIMRYVLRSKGTHAAPRSEGARGRIKASDCNVMATQSVRLPALPREVREAVAARAADLGVPVSALAGWGATFVGAQDGEAVRGAGYRPARAVKYAPNPAPALKGVGEGMAWGGGGAYGLGQRETPDALTATREGRADGRIADALTADANAPRLAALNGPRPLWAGQGGAWQGGVWVRPDGSETPAPTGLRLPFSGGGWVLPLMADAMPQADSTPPAPAPAREADALRPCARPLSTPDGMGCGCGARRKGAPLADGGAHRLVPCDSPRGERCGCGSKAGALVWQAGTPCHAPRARRR